MTPMSVSRRAWMPRQVLAWLPGAVALGAALVMALLLVRMLVILHSALPFWDQFNVATPQQILDTLFDRHNEHLIVLPRLGLLLDLTLTQGSNAINIATILLIQVAHALLLAWVVAVAQGRRIDPLALGVALCFAVSAVQFENLSWGFQTSFVGVFAFATACFATLLFGGVGVGTTVASCLFGAAAALTMANGLLVLPVAVLLALLAGRPRRQVVPLILAALVLGTAYAATHVEVPHHSSPSAALRQPLRIAAFVAVYFGAPIVESLRVASTAAWRFPLAILFGSAGLLIASLLALRALRQRLRISPAEWVLCGVIAFTVVSAAATAAGRLAFGFEQATASRYATPVLLFWCCLLLWPYLLLLRHNARWARVVTGILAGLTIVVASQQPRFLRDMEAYILLRYGAETALLSGADDEDAFRRVYAHTDIVRREGEALRAQRLSIFSAPHAAWLGRPLDGTVRLLAAERCNGQFERAEMPGTAPASFVAASGWAWDAEQRRRITWVLLVDETERIVGFGRGPLRRRDLMRASGRSMPDERVGWAGHAAVGPGVSLRAYGLVGPDSACPLQGDIRPASVSHQPDR